MYKILKYLIVISFPRFELDMQNKNKSIKKINICVRVHVFFNLAGLFIIADA